MPRNPKADDAKITKASNNNTNANEAVEAKVKEADVADMVNEVGKAIVANKASVANHAIEIDTPNVFNGADFGQRSQWDRPNQQGQWGQ